jgi:hypothetical protein
VISFSLATLAVEASPLFLLTLGLGVGILSGLLGVGGGVLMTPALHVLGMSMPMAVGTTLTQMVASSLTGTIKHFRQHNIRPKIALSFGIPALFGVWLGREVMVYWDQTQQADAITSALYIVLLSFIGYVMLKRSRGERPLMRKISESLHAPTQTFWQRIWNMGPRMSLTSGRSLPLGAPTILGVAVGLVSALTGLGGGFFYVPAMAAFLDLEIRVAIGTSLACVFMGSVVGALSFANAGLSDLLVAVILAVGSSIGGVIGASATQHVKGRAIHVMFSFLVWTAALSMLLRRLDYSQISYVLLFGSALIVVLSAVLNAAYHALQARG